MRNLCKIDLSRVFVVIFLIFIYLNENISMAANSDLLINKAIIFKLPVTNNIVSQQALQLQKKMTVEITKADYGNALKIAMSSLDKYPNNFLLQTYLAMIIGDYAEQCEASLKPRMLEKSKSIFKKLMREVDTQPQ